MSLVTVTSSVSTRHRPAWFRALTYEAAFYSKTWRASVISSFLFPILYLSAMGIGVGHLVNAHTGLVEGHTYLHFVAPGLLAITAMQLSVGECMWPILAAIKWVRTYHAAVATPLEPGDLVTGKVAWLGARLFVTTAVYAVIIACFGATSSWTAIFLPFIGALIAVAFAAPLIAFSSRVESDVTFTMLFRFVVVPMLLFSATFYPVSQYPVGLRWIVQLMPLYHGVALCRSAAFGTGSPGALLAHVSVLVAMAVVGYGVARRNLRRRLVS